MYPIGRWINPAGKTAVPLRDTTSKTCLFCSEECSHASPCGSESEEISRFAEFNLEETALGPARNEIDISLGPKA